MTTKSELLIQLQWHKEDPTTKQGGEGPKTSFGDIVRGMKVARTAAARVSKRPVITMNLTKDQTMIVARSPLTLEKVLGKIHSKGRDLIFFR